MTYLSDIKAFPYMVVSISWLLASCNGLSRQQLPNNQSQPLTSPSQEYVLTLPISDSHWQVTIADHDGDVLYRDTESDLASNLQVYWLWDNQERVWLYNSDDSNIFVWQVTDTSWQKQRWGYGCIRMVDQDIEPPLDLWPDYSRPERITYHDIPWQWKGYIGNAATFTHWETDETISLEPEGHYADIKLLSMDLDSGKVDVQIENSTRTLTQYTSESCETSPHETESHQ